MSSPSPHVPKPSSYSRTQIAAIEAVAVTIAMYCIIQFYIQLRNTEQLAPNQPFLKVLAIKLVIFLSFWQSMAISVGTSTLNIVHANDVLAYPDIKVGIPSLLLCVEMALFALLHLWAFPWRGYIHKSKGKKQGGFLGMRALWDAVFIWDVVKGFGRGMRWLFVGVRHRREDISYHNSQFVDMDGLSPQGQGKRHRLDSVDSQYAGKSTDHLPIADQFRASRWYDGGPEFRQQLGVSPPQARDESAGLIQNAQPSPGVQSSSRHGHRAPQAAPSFAPYPSDEGPTDTLQMPGPPPSQSQQHGGYRPSVSTWNSQSDDGHYEDRRPSYVPMDEGLYAAPVAAPVGAGGVQRPFRTHPAPDGRNLT